MEGILGVYNTNDEIVRRFNGNNKTEIRERRNQGRLLINVDNFDPGTTAGTMLRAILVDGISKSLFIWG